MKGQIEAGVRESQMADCAALVTHIVGKERRKLIAEGYGNHASFAFDDLQAEGYIGLCKAADSFDPNMGAKFSTHAYYKIEGHIKEYARNEKKQMMAKSNALLEPANDSDDFTERVAARIDFRSGFKQLSEEEKEILKAYIECSSSIDEAAALLDIPVSEAMDIFLKGKEKLKVAIEEQDRVWQDITKEGIFDFVLLKFWPADPEEALKRFKNEVLLRKCELSEKPFDHYFFEVKNEEFHVIVDPIKNRVSVNYNK